MSIERRGNKVEGSRSFPRNEHGNHHGHHGNHCDDDCKCKPCKPCKPCVDYCAEAAKIKVEKHLLNISYLDNFSGISGPDFVAIYEIVLWNRSCLALKNLSIVDSFLGLDPEPFDSSHNFGGELRPYFTAVTAVGYEPNLFPLTFEQIGNANTGEILDTTQSYLPAQSITRVLVRITGRGFFTPTNPTDNQPIPDSSIKSKVAYILQNSAVIKGSFIEEGHCNNNIEHPIFPIYVRSGIAQVTSNFNFYVAPEFDP